jgi:protein-tyrosine phosphatase
MIDIHCHILPGVDDGPKTWETAVEMCHMAAADGITHIVATPHANDTYAYDRAKHTEALQRLREMTGGTPMLSLGCDFRLSFENLQQLRANRSQFTIGDTPYLLVELSDFAIPPNLDRTLFDLLSTGIRPVITHPERHPLLQRNPAQVVHWAAGGSLIQITASAFTGKWGKPAQKTARWLLDHNAVHVIATDAHDTNSRAPMLSLARDVVADWKGQAVANALVEGNPGAIVRGGALPT